MDILKGKKTYLVAIAGGIVTAAYLLGIIDIETWGVAMGALGASGFATLRAGIGK